LIFHIYHPILGCGSILAFFFKTISYVLNDNI
jgi:hypothetical protein